MTRVASLFLLSSASLFLVHCSLIVASNDSLNGLLCDANAVDPNQACDVGYSCRQDTCVALGSIALGDTCTNSIQCSTNLICSKFQCAPSCTKIFDPNSECGPTQVCIPVYDPTVTNRYLGGACAAPECTAGAAGDVQCQTQVALLVAKDPNNECALLTSTGGGFCLRGCQPGVRIVDDAADGSDSCTTDVNGNQVHCGALPTGTLACLPVGSQTADQPCAVFPLATAGAPDACGLDQQSNGSFGLPLLCLNDKGNSDTSDGSLTCHISSCTSTSQCPAGSNQTCDTTSNFCHS